jgi:cation transport regulator ChaB
MYSQLSQTIAHWLLDRSHFSAAVLKTLVDRYNATFDESNDSIPAGHTAWEAIHQEYQEDEHGVWTKQRATV